MNKCKLINPLVVLLALLSFFEMPAMHAASAPDDVVQLVMNFSEGLKKGKVEWALAELEKGNSKFNGSVTPEMKARIKKMADRFDQLVVTSQAVAKSDDDGAGEASVTVLFHTQKASASGRNFVPYTFEVLKKGDTWYVTDVVPTTVTK